MRQVSVGAGSVLSLDQEVGYIGMFGLGKIHQAVHFCALFCILYFIYFFLFKYIYLKSPIRHFCGDTWGLIIICGLGLILVK